MPFGLRGILPLSEGRFELFAGGGGAYAWHSGDSSANALLFQTSLGARVALDKQHHFWLGTSWPVLYRLGSREAGVASVDSGSGISIWSLIAMRCLLSKRRSLRV